MAGAPRFLDRLEPRRRAVLEPQILDKIAAGMTLDPLLAWCQEQGIEVGRSALSSYLREVRAGGSAEQPGRRVEREVQSPFTPIKPRKPAAEPPVQPPPDEAPLDHVALLRAQMRAAERISQEEPRSADRVAASKHVLQLARELREVERSGGATAPQIHFYFPHKTTIEACEEAE